MSYLIYYLKAKSDKSGTIIYVPVHSPHYFHNIEKDNKHYCC